METNELTKDKNLIKEIQLVKGVFSVLDANEIIMSLINEKINFNKLKRLQIWEGNHSSNTDFIDKRIEELENEKIVLREILKKAKESGYQVEINGLLEISILDKSNV